MSRQPVYEVVLARAQFGEHILLLRDGWQVASAWPVDKQMMRDYLANGDDPDSWDAQDECQATEPQPEELIYYGGIIGRAGKIEDAECREYWHQEVC